MLRTVHFHDEFAKRIGRETITLDADSTAMLMAGLRGLIPEFKRAAYEFPSLKMVVENKKKSKASEPVEIKDPRFGLKYEFKDATDIHFLVVPQGGALPLLAWEVIIAVTTLAATAYISSSIASSMAQKPTANANSASFIFSGATNTTTQGDPIPIGYGIFLIGSKVIASNVMIIDTITGIT